ncbi:hypothetical protein GGF37_000264 [Kickxella alabastrina]|nr:hypothetical protein GGF37_000264 [Kickxella alabastrina]
MLLFQRWHAAGSLIPEFTDPAWRNALVIPARPNVVVSASAGGSGGSDGNLGSAALPLAAAETGRVSMAERLALVRSLISEDRMPVQSPIPTIVCCFSYMQARTYDKSPKYPTNILVY